MTELAYGPGAMDPRAPGRIAYTRVLLHGHRTSGVANAPNVHVSERLPVPCVITEMAWTQTAISGVDRTYAFNLYISNNQSLDTDEVSCGKRISGHRDVGTSPPDLGNTSEYDLATNSTAHVIRLPLWVPVYDSPSYIKTKAIQTILAACRFWIYFTVGLLESTPLLPGEGIIPRGTPEDPTCVRICGWEPGTQPTGPAPAPAPTPTPPAPPTGPAIDPFQEPINIVCPINPENPLHSSALLCEVE